MAEAAAVKERPILMNAEMVRAVLSGAKTMTRRIVKPQPPSYIDELHGYELRKRAPYTLEDFETGCVVGYGFEDDNDVLYKLPYGRVGDRLWVRESMRYSREHDNLYFSADSKGVGVKRYCELQGKFPRKSIPSIHMPRWASRITLEITGVRVERLQEISEADAIAEGVSLKDPIDKSLALTAESLGMKAPIYAFAMLWERINGGGSWAANPWVWVILFKRLEKHG